MNDLARTIIFVIAAAVLAAGAWFLQPAPADIERFNDVGKEFFPDFNDPLAATSLEVIQFDEESGTAVPFKVEFAHGAWTIPSHYSYPADGRDRLSSTATSVIDLRKDILQSDRAQDHETLGLLDPLDETSTSLTGRGERVTLRSETGAILADIIIGKAVPDKTGFRYVRLPDQKRSYAVQLEVDISTRFEDWINTALLEINAPEVIRITVNDYSIDESTGLFNQVGRAQLFRISDTQWSSPNLADGQQLDQAKIQNMLRSLSGLTITGVRPKPGSMTADLRAQQGITLDINTRMSLESKGFFVSNDGRLLSNEGEVTIGTLSGVRYTLRFGEVLAGEGLAVSAGVGQDQTSKTASTHNDPSQNGENRYVFITTDFDESLLSPQPTPPDSSTSDPAAEGDAAAENSQADEQAKSNYERQFAQWQDTADAGRAEAARLNDRFAQWYYVISATDFAALRPSINDLIKAELPPNASQAE